MGNKSESVFGETEAASVGAQVGDRIKSDSSHVSEKAAGAVGSEALGSIGSTVESLRDQIKSIQDWLSARVERSGRDAATSAQNAAAAASEQAKSLATEFEAMARRNPVAFIAGAVVIGLLIGTFGRRS